MNTQLLHVFRNTPLGRETMLQSIYFCNKAGVSLIVYIPEYTKFLMYFDNHVVQVDLDSSYLTAPETAFTHLEGLTSVGKIPFEIFKPKNFTASVLPDVPVDYDFMCCPRSMSDPSSTIKLGFIGSRVRKIIKSAKFPILLTSPVYKEWKSIAVLFGGSLNALNALKLGFRIHRLSGIPLEIFTQIGGKSREIFEKLVADENLETDMKKFVKKWHFFESGKFEENLYSVPHDALVLMGAYGHGIIKDIMFGSKMEKAHSVISNNMLVVGPNYVATN